MCSDTKLTDLEISKTPILLAIHANTRFAVQKALLQPLVELDLQADNQNTLELVDGYCFLMDIEIKNDCGLLSISAAE